MATFTWLPAYNGAVSVAPRVMKSQFGDGYQQRVADGINTQPRAWSLVFTNSVTVSDAIVAFLVARNGVESFDWTPPSGAAGKFLCEEWQEEYLTDNVRRVSAVFREVFGE